MGTGYGRSALLLDRSPIWLAAVERVLTARGISVVGKAQRAEQALELIDQKRPDLLIADLQQGPGELDCRTFLQEASKRHPSLKLIVLSELCDHNQVESAFAAGAHAYLAKKASPEDIVFAVHQTFEPSIHLARAGRQLATAGNGASESGGLTPRQRQVLRLVAEGYSNGEVARTLRLTEQTVKFHLANVYRKLGVANRTEATRWAQLHGLLPETELARST